MTADTDTPKSAATLAPAAVNSEDIELVIAALSYIPRGQSPASTLRSAIALRTEITPRLLDEISLAPVDVKTRYDAEPHHDTAYYLHTFSFYLLALFREPNAYPLMLDYFASDADLAEDLSAEGSYGRILVMAAGDQAAALG